jgi:RNA polymerase sigma factor (sigma-70 family)
MRRICRFVPFGFILLASCSCNDLSPGRHPFSVSSACHVHPGDRPVPLEAGLEPRSDLDEAFRTHGSALLHFLRRKAGPEEASDLVQEVFVRAAGSAQRHRLANPGGFLRRIAQNLLIDRARRQRRTPALFFSLQEESDAVSPPQQEWNMEAEDLLRLYEKAVGTMPFKTQRVFLLHRVDELSYREIHERLGISVATVEYHIMKALGHIAAVRDEYR